MILYLYVYSQYIRLDINGIYSRVRLKGEKNLLNFKSSRYNYSNYII